MNIHDLKGATVGMDLERLIWLRISTGPVPVTRLEVSDEWVQLYTDESMQLTLFDLWQQDHNKRLIAWHRDEETPIFGYRVDGDDIILG